MEERQVTLGQHQLQLEKEMAELEGRQESLARPQGEEEVKMPWQTQCTVLGLLVPAALVMWRQRRDGARAGEPGEEEPELDFLGKVCQGLAFLTKPFLLLRAIGILMGTAVTCLPFFADGLADLALKPVHSRKKKCVFEIP
ncbi:hypothetical protein HGM15179_005844 [Zosterops borbonicus]|uniref:Uncharacterized protein n=1 Tax=Zosterops borbonicus TaxID=364589 RepID=A0A8K1LPR8_9PASS|nr:hypothetical protein HGM15179_005843 [Zosterops borbonicus]TRZ21318.1 hypothetical protein HGM15179_005844 [Zosterops borbonicus]